MKTKLMGVAAAAVAIFALPAAAQTLYKLIDKNGKVTYSEEKPKNFDGEVVPINVDPKANTVTMPKPPDPKARGDEGATKSRTSSVSPRAKANDAEARLEQAKANVESAKKALKEAQDNPGESDLQWIGNKGGGARAIPSEDYQQRLTKLEQAVKEAEDELRRAEKER